ncbi:MAG TPA: CPBP family intramembrane glutamic endopeptidase [Pyrinomonadaceae bacterium]|nr:CPBP family intramembrane glutamic endopeptidase [Pyrinomonadaceae bacterium]
MRKIFINDFGRLRSGWRVVLFILLVIAISLLLTIAIRIAYAYVTASGVALPRATFVWDMLYRLSVLATALAAGYLCTRVLEGLPWRSLGLTLHRGWLKDLLIGTAIGFAALVVAAAIAKLGGGLHFSFSKGGLAGIARSMIGSAVLLIVAALAEEAMFRGYGLQTLARARLASLGVLLTCALFGLGHLGNPNVVPGFTMANTALAGVWLGVAYLRTRSLWFPLGVHWAWNWALGWFFGLPISGANIVSHPLLEASDTGPFWLTGGSYGIEGGFACTIAMLLFTIYTWRTSLVSATPELLKMTSEEYPTTPRPVLSTGQSADYAD